MTLITTVHSYKGGTGKTTIAVNLALNTAARNGSKTLLLDTDFRAQSFQSIFPKPKPTFYINDFMNDACKIKELIHPSGIHENLFVAFSDPNPVIGKGILSHDENWHVIALQRLIEGLNTLEEENEFAFIFFDNTPGLELSALNALFVSDVALLILRPTSYGIAGTKYLLKHIYSQLKGFKARKDYIIWNQVPEGVDSNTRDIWKQNFDEFENVLHIGEIPCNCDITVKTSLGQVFFEPSSTINNLLDSIIMQIIKNRQNK